MKKFGEKIIITTCLSMLVSAISATELSSILKDPKIFATDSKTFMAKYARAKFKWNNRDKSELISKQAGRTGLRLFQILTFETIVRFKDDKVSAVDISVYNRGDAKLVSQSVFYKRIKYVRNKLNSLYGVKGKNIPYKRIAQRKIYSIKWTAPQQTAILEWSSSGRRKSEFKAEFIRLKVSPAGKSTGHLRSSIKTSGELVSRLKRKPDGSVYLELPMVDQGKKAYCAASSVERVLRYYGSDVSQHLIAQLVDTTSYGGSNPEKLLDALKKADVKLGVKVQTYDCGFEMGNYSQFRKFLRKYNKAAKKLKSRQVSEKEIRRNPRIIMWMMTTPAFVYMRRKDRNEFGKFQRAIHNNINKGIPVFWGMIYGLMKEQKQVAGSGGHLRIITGYNDKKNELIYTDTWGAGHEFKSMQIDNAWAVTIGIFTLKPRIKR